MFCKKRKARKAAKNSAVVAAMAMAEKADDLNIPGHADMFAEKLTGKKKAMKKALVGLVLALGIGGVAAYNAARPVEDPWKSA